MSLEKEIVEKVKASFAKQLFMDTLGAKLTLVEKGKVKITCAYQKGLSQQNGFFHAGVLTSIVDSACGYAALTMMPKEADVLSVEFKINLLRPAVSNKIVAVGTVFKAGKTLFVCDGLVMDAKEEKVFAKMTATMFVSRK